MRPLSSVPMILGPALLSLGLGGAPLASSGGPAAAPQRPAPTPAVAAAAAAVRPAVASPADAHLQQAAFSVSRAYRRAQHRIRFSYFSGGLPGSRLVALTFDDGPDPKTTPKILNVLKSEHVPATFFVIGSKVDKHPELVEREAAEGHDIGNHTYHHFELTGLNADAIKFEIERTNEAIERATGGPTRWFRAPGCHYTVQALQTIRDEGMVRVDTTDNTGDWASPGVSTIVHHALDHLTGGDVILCHDRIPETAKALPKIIEQVRARGYRFVSLAELAERAQAARWFKPVYDPVADGVRIDRTQAPRTHRLRRA